MTPRASRAMAVTGASAALLGVATAVLFFFQPWRSCPYEDTSAGCAMLPHDAAMMSTALVIAVVGTVVFVAGMVQRGRSQAARIG